MQTIKVNKWNEIPKNYTGIIEYPNGDKYWFLNNLSHREDGPAIELKNGSKYWYINGRHHREDGAAIEYANGEKEYWFNNRWLDFCQIQELLDLDYPTKAAIKLVYYVETKDYANNRNK